MPEPSGDTVGRSDPARLSVVLPTDCYETIRPVIRRLLRQSARSGIEIVVVFPSGAPLRLDSDELAGFAGVRVVPVEELQPMGRARAAGVRASTAPIVFVGETHTYAHPGWAQALIDAHAGPWAAVAPGFGNANPGNIMSWSSFLLDYGHWLHCRSAGVIDFVPTHNASYKREVLLQFGEELDRVLTHGDQLSASLRPGHLAYLEPAARIDHLNVAQPASWVDERFLCGVMVGSRRAMRWSRLRRLVYFFGSPLIPPLLMARSWRAYRLAASRLRVPFGTLPAMVLGTIISAAGEMVGYARGARAPGESRMQEYELHKVRYAADGAR